MRQGKMLPPGAGRLIAGGALHATLKVAGGPRGDGAVCSTSEIVVPPGYDVGAHVHTRGEDLFYVLEGMLDLLAFEPLERTRDDWHTWISPGGQRYLRGGPGSILFVPAGHEDYFEELAALLRASNGKPDPQAMAELRSRHDIHQLTRLRT